MGDHKTEIMVLRARELASAMWAPEDDIDFQINMSLLEEHPKRDVRHCVVHQEEYGLPNVLVLVLWTGAFKDLAAFLDDLRPMLYVYWA